MSEPANPYKLTLAELRDRCPLLASIEVLGHPGAVIGCSYVRKGTERLVGRNAAGEIIVEVKGKVTPKLVEKFRDSYRMAIAAGILKPKGATNG